jgi:REP element-mobilizing transposase RayT
VNASEQGEKESRRSPSIVQPVDKEVFDSSADVLLKQTQPNLNPASYTCFLIPQNPSQQLIDGLIDALPRWLTAICTSSGWKLEFVKVTPGYFQWALSVLPSVSTGSVLHQIRSQTSEMILADHAHLKEAGASDCFWATGYLVLSGLQPEPREIIEHYIRIIRKHQYL